MSAEASDEINDDAMLEKAETDLKEAGLQLFSQAEVKSSIGVEREGWLQALREEVDSLKKLGSITTGARARFEAHGKVDDLPAKIVWERNHPNMERPKQRQREGKRRELFATEISKERSIKRFTQV